MTDEAWTRFVLESYHLLQDHVQSGRYFHTLSNQDNSPTVVHHRTNQMTYVVSGSGLAWLNGVEQAIAPGSSIYVPAGTTHRFLAQSSQMVLFHIHIPDSGRETDREIVEGADYHGRA